VSEVTITVLLDRARSAVEIDDAQSAAVAWGEAERLGGLVGVAVRDRLGSATCDEDGLSWSLWGAVGGNVSAMCTAACCYRDGVGTRRDYVQALRWYLTMFVCGDGDGVHNAIELVKRGMTDAQIVQAGRLAGAEQGAQSLIRTVPVKD
jgi:uncharacterized protein